MRSQTLVAQSRSERSAACFDLGVEPALELDGERHSPLDHRRVSVRWLLGTVLTGLFGAALIGLAIFSALDRKTTFAEAPAIANVQRKETIAAGPRRGDRLVKPIDIVAAKQTFRTPTIVHSGDKEVVRVRGFTRVATTLTLTPTPFADEVPDFNPLKLLGNAQNPIDAPAETGGPDPDEAEVSFVMKDLAGAPVAADALTLSADEVQAQVAEHARAALAAGSKPPLPLPSQLLLMRTSRASLDPTGGLAYARGDAPLPSSIFSSIDVRMVPENVTLIGKSPPRSNAAPEERLVIVRHNETLDDALRSADVPRDDLGLIVTAFNRRGGAAVLEGQRLKVQFADLEGSGQATKVARVSLYADETLQSTIALSDGGGYVRVENPAAPRPARPLAGADDDEDASGMRLYDSIYETALKQEIPKPVIDDLVRIFANDIDFQTSARGGDTIEAFYAEPDESEGRNELLYAAIVARGETYRYYRFQMPDDGQLDFYDENGRSTRKFLIRKPMDGGEVRSGFGFRRHPVLGYFKMHTGVDWAASVGTPIYAAGNGVIIKAAWDAGYGRRIEIQHANGYITTYNHQSGFARGIKEGVRVRQGQTIGFVGQTGLVTGPHLHYEVLVNGRFVDPMRVKLARTREFDGRLLAEFKRERDRIDALMAKAPNAAPRLVAAQQRIN